MPFCTAFFVPRTNYDRPKVVPEHVVNFAFIGQFAETERDTIFTTQYSVRTAMEAVYTLLNVERAVPEVWGSMYDIRCWLKSIAVSRDYEKARAAWTAYGGTGPYGHRNPAPQVRGGGVIKTTKTRPSMSSERIRDIAPSRSTQA
jgi:MCRA family